MLHIHLPEEYEKTDLRYPVIYFFDGHNLFSDEDATYGTCWKLEDFLARWQEECIVVGLECGHKPNQRLDEYSPYPMEIVGYKTKGMGEATLGWMISTLKPEIDGRLRTLPEREETAIAGSSMGGLMSLYALVRHNEIFSMAASLSPSIQPCLQEVVNEIGKAKLASDTRIWLSFGEKELNPKREKAFELVKKVLVAKGITLSSQIQAFGSHNEKSWGELVPAFMPYLLR